MLVVHAVMLHTVSDDASACSRARHNLAERGNAATWSDAGFQREAVIRCGCDWVPYRMPKKERPAESAPLPSTLERSPQKAQDTYEETLASAEKSYDGDEARAHRAAWASVKHGFEKVGDHWEPKEHSGPSDPRAKQGGPNATGKSYGGVDVEGKSKAALVAQAKRAGAAITSRMTKADIATAIEHANDGATRAARGR